MGFSKCYLTTEIIENTYNESKLDGIIHLLKSYNSYICDEQSLKIMNLYKNGQLTNETIQKIIYQSN